MDLTEVYNKIIAEKALEFWTLIFTFITTILWGVYVIYTTKTFNQIKKQTDLQIRAFIMSTAVKEDLIENHSLPVECLTLHKKWKEILEHNLSESMTGEKVIFLKLTNRGKSDICKWKILVSIDIEQGIYLKSRFNIEGDKSKWSINSSNSQIISPDQEIKIPISFSGFFPKAIYSWRIEYEDIREQIGKSENSSNRFEDINKIAFEYKEVDIQPS